MEIEMVLIHCANCGMPFAITRDRQDRLRECHNTFYCPMGHPQNYSAKSEKEILLERIASRDKIIADLEAAQQKMQRTIRKARAKTAISKPKQKTVKSAGTRPA